ncbi:chromosomal replication initiator protein DnaA [Patescibacteria group bacterium]|nr:chromosomal replication initiator protein DnaA [Patescibacteria group bacterium]MBU4162048.1 chromosomal replication initiator protein DnaA [Patescibacteria group bacterium]
MNKEELWQAILSQIQFNISQANFSTWFKNTYILSNDNGTIIIAVPNNFSKEWLERKYNKLILNGLEELNERVKVIEYRVVNVPAPQMPKKSVKAEIADINQLELEELALDKYTNLNPRYTFDNFVVGPFNELAHAAGWAVSQKPGLVYNPFFVYGGVGLGKTHLLQAIGNKVYGQSAKKKIKYVSSERFISGIINSIRNQTIDEFKNTYRDFDMLIIDDIQFLAGKEKTQEEFFHLFNILYESNKQIIISSDRPPKAISALEERLRSRFEGGMITDIGTPDFESRIAILKQKIQEKKAGISGEVLEYIASNIQKNVRELEGALKSLAAWKQLHNQDIDLDLAKKVLKRTINPQPKGLNFQKIINTVAEFYNMKDKDLYVSSRKKEIVRPRQIAMYFLREELKSSFPFIGKKFGGKDHTTAIYACEKISKEIIENEQFAEEIILIKEKIYSY